MAQQFPTSAQVIYDTLVADATFMSLLGTYNFQNGVGSVPAISVVSPGENLPELRKVKGIECVIQDTGNISRTDYLTENSSLTIEWKVFLICWDDSKGQDMTNAALRASLRFSGATTSETTAAADGLGALVQTMITIPSDKPILG